MGHIVAFFQQSLWLDPVFSPKECFVGVALGPGELQGRPDAELFNVQGVPDS